MFREYLIRYAGATTKQELLAIQEDAWYSLHQCELTDDEYRTLHKVHVSILQSL